MYRKDFLKTLGLGVGAFMLPSFDFPKASSKEKVIVVGAGMAGASAAYHLQQAGHEVVVLEARNRIGGRIHTVRDWGIPLELGANWIHGVNHPDNLLDERAKALGIAMQKTNFTRLQMFDPKGREISNLRAKWGMLRNQVKLSKAFDRLKNESIDLPLEKLIDQARPTRASHKQLHIHKLISESYVNSLGEDLDRVSGLFYGRDYGQNGFSRDYLVLGGYDGLVKDLLRGIDVRLEQAVSQIRQQPGEVRVLTQKESFSADRVVVTVPISLLQQNKIQFIPALPQEKTEAFHKIKLGLFNKVFLEFDAPFWKSDKDFLVVQDEQVKGCSILVNFQAYARRPILKVMAVGEGARWVEEQSDEAIRLHWEKRLSRAFPDKDTNVKRIKVIRWQHEPFTQGSYSYAPIGSSFQEFEALAKPVGRIHFAGEATTGKHHGTVHGAFLSGQREARRILAFQE